jgi:hypothetical protein
MPHFLGEQSAKKRHRRTRLTGQRWLRLIPYRFVTGKTATKPRSCGVGLFTPASYSSLVNSRLIDVLEDVSAPSDKDLLVKNSYPLMTLALEEWKAAR